MASLTSEGVLLGTTANHTFSYIPSHRRPAHAWLNVSILTENSEGGLDFNPYYAERLGEGNGSVAVPPPPMLDSAMPYLLLAVATDNERGQVPRDIQEYIGWVNAEYAPMSITGRLADGTHMQSATRTAKQWLSEYWSLPDDKRRSPPEGMLEERFVRLLDAELPMHNLTSSMVSNLVQTLVHQQQDTRKRAAADKQSCEVCRVALTTMISVTGLMAGLSLLATRSFERDATETTYGREFVRALLEFHDLAIHRPSIYGVPVAMADIASRLGIITSYLRGTWNGMLWTLEVAKFLCEKMGACADS